MQQKKHRQIVPNLVKEIYNDRKDIDYKIDSKLDLGFNETEKTNEVRHGYCSATRAANEYCLMETKKPNVPLMQELSPLEQRREHIWRIVT